MPASTILRLENANSSLAENPYDAETYKIRGNVYKDLKKYDEAIADYNKAIELSPKYAHLTTISALLTILLFCKYDIAMEYYNKALELDPNFYLSYKPRGEIYEIWSSIRPGDCRLYKSDRKSIQTR